MVLRFVGSHTKSYYRLLFAKLMQTIVLNLTKNDHINVKAILTVLRKVHYHLQVLKLLRNYFVCASLLKKPFLHSTGWSG